MYRLVVRAKRLVATSHLRMMKIHAFLKQAGPKTKTVFDNQGKNAMELKLKTHASKKLKWQIDSKLFLILAPGGVGCSETDASLRGSLHAAQWWLRGRRWRPKR